MAKGCGQQVACFLLVVVHLLGTSNDSINNLCVLLCYKLGKHEKCDKPDNLQKVHIVPIWGETRDTCYTHFACGILIKIPKYSQLYLAVLELSNRDDSHWLDWYWHTADTQSFHALGQWCQHGDESQYSTVQYCTVKYSIVQTVQYSTVRYSTVKYSSKMCWGGREWQWLSTYTEPSGCWWRGWWGEWAVHMLPVQVSILSLLSSPSS